MSVLGQVGAIYAQELQLPPPPADDLELIDDSEIELDPDKDPLPIGLADAAGVQGSVGAAEALVDWYPVSPGEVNLSLGAYRQRVLTHNETIQMHLLGVLIADKNYKAAKGIFEPEYVGTLERVDSRRPNTAEQRRNQGGIDVFEERNLLSTNGIEMRTPTNGQFRLGMNTFELQNNLQDRDPKEYSTFLGANVTQPLLRNAGSTAAMASIRLAGFESELAFQEYRRQMMVTIAAAESSYWNVFYASQQRKFSQESLAMAKSIHADLELAFEAGKATKTDVMAARVGVLERESNLSVASQRLFEANNLMISYYSGAPPSSAQQIAITDVPPRPPSSMKLNRDTEFKMAVNFNPDYLRRAKQGEIEDLRIKYAKNQTRPQIDLKGSYGLNGLGADRGAAGDDIGDREYPAWSVGVEMRVPLLGGRTLKNQLDAAKARKLQALLGLKQVEVQLYSAVDNVLRKAESTLASFSAHRAAVGLNESLLADARMSLEAGRIDIRTIFEIEQDLSESKDTALRDIVDYQNAKLERELVTGMVFFNRNWEVSRSKLQNDTDKFLKQQVTTKKENEKRATNRNLPPAGTEPVRRSAGSSEQSGTAGELEPHKFGRRLRGIFSRED
ncbi:MAG: outer membrane protein TolC [Verrucomicrobiales bacterium]|jgi:outer membrane protein TolC